MLTMTFIAIMFSCCPAGKTLGEGGEQGGYLKCFVKKLPLEQIAPYTLFYNRRAVYV
jgi:hypothetical protein